MGALARNHCFSGEKCLLMDISMSYTLQFARER
jgi:hypothetical protein